MRSIKPREEHIRSCGGSQVRDSRDYFPYTAPACRNELEFNDYLLTGLMYHTPPALRTAFSRRLRTGHRVVFTHADLAPRNIIVRDGKIVGLLDWEDAGWYPEYWEYVKFFHRVGSGSLWDWLRYADDIFSATDENELVHYIALPTWQDP
ncbi:uncharacterized protein DNG_03907 [Cephalotrichum gorgonifer]|uniref:Aminoglycoside phosphotransferase domain-containing protein n=1 Tax=Cephalotrichum gorgonifer TaxID=2041049 RepID=A0AAE8MVX0_9PEZI|nr:uncharacterized protein DNG_03907 [Cephalotrichum gorgonifer]